MPPTHIHMFDFRFNLRFFSVRLIGTVINLNPLCRKGCCRGMLIHIYLLICCVHWLFSGSLQEVSAAGSDVFCGSTEEHHRSAPSGGNSAGTPQGIDHVCVDGVCDPRAVTACGAYAGNGRDTNNSEGCGSDCSVSDSSGSDSSGSVVSWQFVTTNEVSALYKRWAQCVSHELCLRSIVIFITSHSILRP